jgi:biotin carboxyl carrier protein
MKLVSVVEGNHFPLKIVPDKEREGVYVVEIDGERISVEVVELKPTSITMGIGSRIGFYEFSRSRGRLSEVNLGNHSYRVEVKTPQQDELERLLAKYSASGAGATAQKLVTAPMPGKILEIYVKENEQVQLGNVVAVLEAMKMENEISSTVEGTVKALKVKPGDSVARDQPLIEFV